MVAPTDRQAWSSEGHHTGRTTGHQARLRVDGAGHASSDPIQGARSSSLPSADVSILSDASVLIQTICHLGDGVRDANGARCVLEASSTRRDREVNR